MSFIRGVAFWAYYTAWDTAVSGGKTGDKANHTVKVSKDGGATTTMTNSGHLTNHVELANGEYAILVTATEATCDSINIYGASATSNVVLIPFRAMTGILDTTDGIEVGLTLRQALRLIAAACAGKVSGMEALAPIIRNAVADTKPRITSTTDSRGNRLTITTDLT